MKFISKFKIIYKINCDLAFVVNIMGCCCMEIEQCHKKLYEYEHENTRKCVIDQPGFTDVSLNAGFKD